ncbi:MAG: hypothetical protein AAGE01_16285 [Pseudomonadota bacterium]
MLVFVSTRRHAYTHRDVVAALGRQRARSTCWEDLLQARRVLQGTYVLTDFDRLSPEQHRAACERASRLRTEHGCRVLNDPVRMPTRFGLLRRLHRAGLNDFDAHRVEACPDELRFPVFLRSEVGHERPLSDLLNDPQDVAAALDAALEAGHPESRLLLIEFRGEPVDGGLYRRIGAYRVGDQIVAAEHVHERHWCVKYGTPGGATTALYEEEFETVTANPYAEELMRRFELAGIDYGRADFAFAGGRIQLFEINTNPEVHPPGEHPIPLRRRSEAIVWENYLSALVAIDAEQT